METRSDISQYQDEEWESREASYYFKPSYLWMIVNANFKSTIEYSILTEVKSPRAENKEEKGCVKLNQALMLLSQTAKHWENIT